MHETTVPVARGDGPVAELPRASERLDLELPPHADGLAVVRDGELVAELGETGPHVSQSLAKSVLGLLAGVLVGQGRLDPDTIVTDHVPEVEGSGYDGATVRHLLDMRAAIDFTEDGPQYAGGSIRTFLPTIGPAEWAHGERFLYASPNTDLLGIVVERAAGAPLAATLSDALWAKLGAEQDAALAVDADGTAVISSGLRATLRDYARLGMLVADGGRGVVPADWIAALGGTGYANHWWWRDGALCARGIHGQLIAVARASKTVLVLLSSWPTATNAKLEARQRVLVRKLT